MARPRTILAALVTGALACACDGRPAPSAAPPAASASPADAGDAVERLRALGYVGFAPAADGHGSGVVLRDPRASAPGDDFFTSPHLCSATLVDEAGTVVNHWHESPCRSWSEAHLLDDGDLVVLGVEEAGDAGGDEDLTTRRYVMKLGWDGRLLWKRPLPAHHDIEPVPGGLLTLTAANRVIPSIDPARPVRDIRVALLSADGIEKESVSLYDAWTATPEAPPLEMVRRGRKPVIDLFHANSVERLPAPPKGLALWSEGDVLVAVRHQDAVVIVDGKARRLRWAWGRGQISGPHDARLLPDGHVLLFDNGLSRRWSRVLEVDPATGGIVWQYRAPVPADFFTVSRGSNQRLANGNTLVAQSDAGRAFEVAPDGRIVWEFWNPFHNDKGQRATLVRMRRIDAARVAAILRQRGPGRGTAPDAVIAGSPAPAASASAPR